jgi:hypothetical protein
VFGQLNIVPSADLGEIGPQQGEAIRYDWKWHYSAAGFVIWLALILAAVLPKANHNVQVLWIFVPLVVVNLLWLAFKEASDMPSTVAIYYDTLVQSMVIGLAVLWLVLYYLKKLVGAARFFIAFAIVFIVASLGILPYYIAYSRDTFMFSVLFIVITLALLLAMTLSSILCRKRYTPGRFMLWLALWILIGSILSISTFYIVIRMTISSIPSWSYLLHVLLSATLTGSIFGILVYVLNLPFMILGFVSPFFRERFCACLNLKSTPTPEESVAGSNVD